MGNLQKADANTSPTMKIQDSWIFAPPEVMERAANIKIVVLDVDGVLTDGSLYYDDDGKEYKAFYARDGHGMKMLMQSGVEIGVISGRNSPVVEKRMRELGISHFYQGHLEKRPVFDTLLRELGIRQTEAAYVGDDLVDLPVMLHAYFAITVPDAHPLVTRHAHWCTPNAGGRGAVRDVCELIMAAQGMLVPQIEMTLR